MPLITRNPVLTMEWKFSGLEPWYATVEPTSFACLLSISDDGCTIQDTNGVYQIFKKEMRVGIRELEMDCGCEGGGPETLS